MSPALLLRYFSVTVVVVLTRCTASDVDPISLCFHACQQTKDLLETKYLEGLEARQDKKKRFDEHESKMRKHIRKVMMEYTSLPTVEYTSLCYSPISQPFHSQTST